MFSCEFCEISKKTFFYRTPPVAAFEYHDTCNELEEWEEWRSETLSQLTFTCSKSTIETLEKGVKYVQS